MFPSPFFHWALICVSFYSCVIAMPLFLVCLCVFVCVPPQNKASIDAAGGALEGVQSRVELRRRESVWGAWKLPEGFERFTQTQTFSLLFTSLNGTPRRASSHTLSQVGPPAKGHGGPISNAGDRAVSHLTQIVLYGYSQLCWAVMLHYSITFRKETAL